MDVGNWIASTATVVSIAAGVVSWSQARSAKESADYAKRQTVAAEEQLRLAREQFAAEVADRHEANGPEFNLEPESVYYDEQRFAKMTLHQTTGPA
ncbi:hypothetical protein [Streptomyces sp. NPDC001307]|uniref:hypothetical protein n=1 Tax=Streptomyces sp. NPDC001307 TaxID=3364560 RepID=UPI0036923D78